MQPEDIKIVIEDSGFFRYGIREHLFIYESWRVERDSDQNLNITKFPYNIKINVILRPNYGFVGKNFKNTYISKLPYRELTKHFDELVDMLGNKMNTDDLEHSGKKYYILITGIYFDKNLNQSNVYFSYHSDSSSFRLQNWNIDLPFEKVYIAYNHYSKSSRDEIYMFKRFDAVYKSINEKYENTQISALNNDTTKTDNNHPFSNTYGLIISYLPNESIGILQSAIANNVFLKEIENQMTPKIISIFGSPEAIAKLPLAKEIPTINKTTSGFYVHYDNVNNWDGSIIRGKDKKENLFISIKFRNTNERDYLNNKNDLFIATLFKYNGIWNIQCHINLDYRIYDILGNKEIIEYEYLHELVITGKVTIYWTAYDPQDSRVFHFALS